MICNRWESRLIIKGILNPADAVKAIAIGAEGIVSNNKARQLDGSVAPSDAAPCRRSSSGKLGHAR